MWLIEKLVREDWESEQRMKAAWAAAVALTDAERRKLVVELVKVLEREQDGTHDVPPKPAFVTEPLTTVAGPERPDIRGPKHVEPDASRVEKVQALLAEHPEGLTPAEIGQALGDWGNIHGTLRWLKRRTDNGIVKRGNRWFLVHRSPKKLQLRDAIREAITAAGKPLSASEILKSVRVVKPAVTKGSIGSEIWRMQKANCLFIVGKSWYGGGMYALEGPANPSG